MITQEFLSMLFGAIGKIKRYNLRCTEGFISGAIHLNARRGSRLSYQPVSKLADRRKPIRKRFGFCTGGITEKKQKTQEETTLKVFYFFSGYGALCVFDLRSLCLSRLR
jgi:hypothetical protein